MKTNAALLALFLPLVAVASLPACATNDDAGVDDDPVFVTGKADGLAPLDKGLIQWNAPAANVSFENAADDSPVTYVDLRFDVSGPATISITTQAAAGDATDENLDTVLYIYQPTATSWGHYLKRDDNATSHTKFSTIQANLKAGSYRAVVKRNNGTGNPKFAYVATCSGTGCTAPPVGCTPTTPRTADPEVFVGPTQWQSSIEDQIDNATTSLDVQMYLFTVGDIADHIIAAQNRGVIVRVLLDPHENNAAVQAKLTAAGVPNKTDPTIFTYAHAKYMVIDNDTAVILSGNFNAGAVGPTSSTDSNERNYGIVDHDFNDVAVLESIYNDDWTSTSGTEPDLSCTRLIVSPVNSKQRVLDHINAAMHTLDIELLYLQDNDVRDAIVAAKARGATVRLILSNPAVNTQNTATISYFKSKGIAVKVLLANYLHAKMIQSDGVAQVASENMSATSLTMNREVGALVFETVPAGQIHAQYEADWAAAISQ